MTADALAMLGALFPAMPADERAIVCGFRGDPAVVRASAWRPRPWRPGARLPFTAQDNAYVCVSSFRVAPDGTWRRRREGFAAAWALMVDDVGTKVPTLTVKALAPSAVVETSPGNAQVWYLLSGPCTDRERFGAVVDAFIDAQLLGADPGMAGFNRVGRLPGSVNGKAKYGGAYPVTLQDWHPERRYSLDEITSAFGLKPQARRRRGEVRALIDVPLGELQVRVELFKAHIDLMAQRGMLKSHAPDAGGWIDVVCPWVDNHTGGVDNGSAVRIPDAANGFYGGYRCHHGGCAGRGWRDLTEWLNETNVEMLDKINREAAHNEPDCRSG